DVDLHEPSFVAAHRLRAGWKRTLTLRPPERVAQHDRLFAVRAGRNQIDRDTAQRFDPREVGARRPGQLRMLFYADRAFLPARHLFIHRGAQLELLGADGENLGETALELVSDAD